MSSPLLEQVKIQAQVLVPLLRAFRQELGTERANFIAWKALERWRAGVVSEMAKTLPAEASNVDRFQTLNQSVSSMVGDAVDVKWVRGQSAFEEGKVPEQWEFDITGCRFAQFFRELGEPELGFALLCSFDNTAADEVGKGEVEFTRTQTIMQGGAHCDFRYSLKKKGLA
jgi:L-2-amino-thiazoline-4-carboxylic acid hydrolase